MLRDPWPVTLLLLNWIARLRIVERLYLIRQIIVDRMSVNAVASKQDRSAIAWQYPRIRCLDITHVNS